MTETMYIGDKTKQISFPLGGIGTGCIGLSGNGRLIDWEIFNRPNKRSFNGFSHFAVKAEAEGKVLDARILNGDMESSYLGEPIRGASLHSGYGFGPESNTMAGMPHFEKSSFTGEFPIASIDFYDIKFPGKVRLTAFNPFVPLNGKDSSIPGSFFEITINNTTDSKITYTTCLSVANQIPTEKVLNKYELVDKLHIIKLASEQFFTEDPNYGDISIATDADETSYQEYWYRGGWCDNLEMFWRDFTKAGRLENRNYSVNDKPSNRHKDMSSLAAHFDILPGQEKNIKFIITWNYPNMYNYWNPEKSEHKTKTVWKNYYSTVFKDSSKSATYALENWQRLFRETLTFKETLFSSTIPDVVKEAVSANLSVLKSPTSLRLTDGSFYGFEGCIEDTGCCEGSCSHVWNYAYAMPFLFPKLERSMRDLDFKYNQREDGRMSFRLMLPLGRTRMDFRACVDGQFGGVIKAYRDWKICGDDEWLKSNWGAIKKSIEYAWSESNEDKWDADKDGVIEGRQHHTLDMELFGPNSWLNGFYLAALKAGAEMAQYLGETETAKEYMDLFKKGKKWSDEQLFNGEYYSQKLKLDNKDILEKCNTGISLFGEDIIKAYWNDEAKEIKYQIGEGCEIDQVVAQWHANLCGLGEIFDKEQTKKALSNIYTNNFISSMRDVANTWRLFSLNNEGGLIICSWPKGKYRPAIPLTYSTETMTGFEYQVAAHMIQEGMVEGGLSIVSAVRDRYDGEKRNPWSEIECGSNYARSMASYSLLLSMSGFKYDMTKGMIGFEPYQFERGCFKCFWSLASGWGEFEVKADRVEIKVLYGELNVKEIYLPFVNTVKAAYISGERITINFTSNSVLFDSSMKINRGDSINIEMIMKI